jgi:hypothetical protein
MKKIEGQLLLSLIRHGLTAGGSYIVANGYANNTQAQTITGALLVVIGLVWSYFNKKNLLPIEPDSMKD